MDLIVNIIGRVIKLSWEKWYFTLLWSSETFPNFESWNDNRCGTQLLVGWENHDSRIDPMVKVVSAVATWKHVPTIRSHSTLRLMCLSWLLLLIIGWEYPPPPPSPRGFGFTWGQLWTTTHDFLVDEKATWHPTWKVWIMLANIVGRGVLRDNSWRLDWWNVCRWFWSTLRACDPLETMDYNTWAFSMLSSEERGAHAWSWKSRGLRAGLHYGGEVHQPVKSFSPRHGYLGRGMVCRRR